MVDNAEEEQALFPERAGDRLRAARTRGGLDLSDVASRTRIPLRHLLAIEAGDYSAFPSSTYCVGFVKAYARAVGEDEHALAQQVRIELGQEGLGYRTELQDYDDADPARVPSRTLAWTAAAVAALLAIGYGVWRTMVLAGPEVAPTPVAVTAPGPKAPAATLPAAGGEVALTAIEPVWVRIYDSADKVLFEKEMAKGERFVVPSDASNPMIRTGRAQLLAVTINGSAVPALGPAERTLKDVGISAAALLARTAPAAEQTVADSKPEAVEDKKPELPKPVTEKKQAAERTVSPASASQTKAATPAPVTAPVAAPPPSEAPPQANSAAPAQPQP